MKIKYYFMMLSACALMSSCQKNASSVQTSQENQPIKVTLTATIGGDDTKVSYVEEDNVLKTEWELYDKVSVLSLDSGGNVLANNVFTATSAGKTGVFEGEFSNNPQTASVWVYYPALTEGEGTEEKPWQVPSANSLNTFGVLSDVKVNHTYSSTMDFSSGYQLQKESNVFSNLEQFMVMSGEADIEKLASSKLDVRLYHRSYVVKMDITLPKAGLTVHHLNVYAKTSDDQDIPISGCGWVDINKPESFPGGQDSFWVINFGDDMNVLTYSGTGLKVDGTTLTAYVVGYGGVSWNYIAQQELYYTLTAGDYLTFDATITDNGSNYNCVPARKDITKTTKLENGKMYRLSATLEKKQAE